MQSGQKRWKDLYEFDTPVVGFLFLCLFFFLVNMERKEGEKLKYLIGTSVIACI